MPGEEQTRCNLRFGKCQPSQWEGELRLRTWQQVRRAYIFHNMRLFTALAFLLSTAFAGAALRLDGDHVDVKPKPEDEVATVTFSFKNDGNKPVRVLHLESACSCLSASLDSAVYQPGQKGTGKAEFKVSSFTGQQEKTISVTTDDPAQPEWVVPFIVDIPVVVDIDPKMVQWWLNEKPVPKEVTVKMTGKDPMKLVSITSTRENMTFSSKEVKPGREYVVTMTPKTTDDVMIGALKLETDSKIPKYQRQLAFFGVVRQPETKKAEPNPNVEVIAKPQVEVKQPATAKP